MFLWVNNRFGWYYLFLWTNSRFGKLRWSINKPLGIFSRIITGGCPGFMCCLLIFLFIRANWPFYCRCSETNAGSGIFLRRGLYCYWLGLFWDGNAGFFIALMCSFMSDRGLMLTLLFGFFLINALSGSFWRILTFLFCWLEFADMFSFCCYCCEFICGFELERTFSFDL